jgi:hypothetical protein
MSNFPPNFQDPYQQPIEYAQPVPGGRPGVLTALGIVSIVLGSFSVIASFSGIVSGIMYLTMFNRMTFTPPTTQPVMTTTQTANGATAISTTVIAGPGISFHVPPGASWLSIVEGSLSACMAIVLITAGILMLRNSPGSYRLHRVYAVAKLPLIMMAAIATWWTVSSMMNNMMAGMPNSPPGMQGIGNMTAIFEAIFYGLFAAVYPVVILIVLSMRTAKEWRERMGG